MSYKVVLYFTARDSIFRNQCTKFLWAYCYLIFMPLEITFFCSALQDDIREYASPARAMKNIEHHSRYFKQRKILFIDHKLNFYYQPIMKCFWKTGTTLQEKQFPLQRGSVGSFTLRKKVSDFKSPYIQEDEFFDISNQTAFHDPLLVFLLLWASAEVQI